MDREKAVYSLNHGSLLLTKPGGVSAFDKK
jgi:hypothetical protein